MNKSNIINSLLVSIKNGYSNKNKYAYCKINKFCLDILWVLYKEGLISDFKIQSKISKVQIRLKYIKNKPLLTNINLISKPSLNHYSSFYNLKNFYNKYDYFFMSTSTGIISSSLLLKNNHIGGKVLFGLKINS
jgi:ribosomal protein S8